MSGMTEMTWRKVLGQSWAAGQLGSWAAGQLGSWALAFFLPDKL